MIYCCIRILLQRSFSVSWVMNGIDPQHRLRRRRNEMLWECKNHSDISIRIWILIITPWFIYHLLKALWNAMLIIHHSLKNCSTGFGIGIRDTFGNVMALYWCPGRRSLWVYSLLFKLLSKWGCNKCALNLTATSGQIKSRCCWFFWVWQYLV